MDTCTYCPRCIDAGALGTLAELLPLIAVNRLDQVRNLLLEDARWSGLNGAQRLLRADLLDATARRLVEEAGRDPANYLARGELHPEVPSDTRGLAG
ncbi:hypothetical protein [Nocardioides sp. MH1]|uniref:hypothetical protein n=1 Tax=Nocardioides sp. MH1 TaxID=3242490 RepID=UPI00352215C2